MPKTQKSNQNKVLESTCIYLCDNITVENPLGANKNDQSKSWGQEPNVISARTHRRLLSKNPEADFVTTL